TRQAEGLQGLSAEEHLRRCVDLAARGYRPVALSLAVLDGDKAPRAASAWHRPVDLAGRQALSRRQAGAPAPLPGLKEPGKVWPLFRHSQDPTLRSWLVWKAGELGCDPRQPITRLDVEKDASARRALIVALGEFAERQLPADVRAPVVKKLLSWYRDD